MRTTATVIFILFLVVAYANGRDTTSLRELGLSGGAYTASRIDTTRKTVDSMLLKKLVQKFCPPAKMDSAIFAKTNALDITPDSALPGAQNLIGQFKPVSLQLPVFRLPKTAGQLALASPPAFSGAAHSFANAFAGPAAFKKALSLKSFTLGERLSKKLESFIAPRYAVNLALESGARYAPPLGFAGPSNWSIVTGLKGNITLFGLPFNINMSNSRAALNGLDPMSANLFRAGLDPDAFSGLLKNQLQQYTELKNSVFHGFDFTGYVRQTLSEEVHSLENKVTQVKTGYFDSYLKDGNRLQSLIALPDAELRSRLMSVASQQPPRFSGPDSTAELAKWKQQGLEKADSVSKVIIAIKSELLKKGIDPNKLLMEENYLTGKTSNAFNTSEFVTALRARNPSTLLQSVLGRVTDLRIGAFGNQIPGAVDNQGRLVNGGNLVVKLNGNPYTFGFGKLNDLNSLKDAGYETSIYTKPQSVTYIGGDIKNGFFGKGKFSIVSSFNGQSTFNRYSSQALLGNSVAFTITKYIKMGKFGNLALDASKSAFLSDNNYQVNREAIIQSGAGINPGALNNNFFQSVAVGFTHDLNISQLDMSDNFYFNYGGLGYKNPANNGNSGSVIKYGGNLKKSFYNRRLNLTLRSDFREMPLSYVSNNKWKNYQVQLASRYKLNNHSSLSLKFLTGGTDKVINGASSLVYSTQKLELDGNSSYKIGSHFSVSHFSIGNQRLNNAYASSMGSNLLNVNFLQSVAFKSTVLTGTVYYNKELSGYKLIGDLLTADVTYQYQLFNKLQLSSGITYLSNGVIARQAGFRQSLQLVTGKHYDINASADIRKNLISPQYADLYAAARGELTFRYYLKAN
jgi:hypothetical protein